MAEIFIYAVYLIMGMVVYSAQGQYTYATAYQGIPNSAYSCTASSLSLSTDASMLISLL